MLNVAILRKLKAQNSGTLALPSAEAEFVALSEAAKEIKIEVQVLVETIGICVKLPIIVRVDNVGAVFMGKIVSTSSRMRHLMDLFDITMCAST